MYCILMTCKWDCWPLLRPLAPAPSSWPALLGLPSLLRRAPEAGVGVCRSTLLWERPGSYGASSVAGERLAPVRLPYQDAAARGAEMAVLVEGLGHTSAREKRTGYGASGEDPGRG